VIKCTKDTIDKISIGNLFWIDLLSDNKRQVILKRFILEKLLFICNRTNKNNEIFNFDNLNNTNGDIIDGCVFENIEMKKGINMIKPPVNGKLIIERSIFNGFKNCIISGERIIIDLINNSFKSIDMEEGIIFARGASIILMKECVFLKCESSSILYLESVSSLLETSKLLNESFLLCILHCDFSFCKSFENSGIIVIQPPISQSLPLSKSHELNIGVNHFTLFNSSFYECVGDINGCVILQNVSNVGMIVESCVFDKCDIFHNGDIIYSKVNSMEKKFEESCSNNIFNMKISSYFIVNGTDNFPVVFSNCFKRSLESKTKIVEKRRCSIIHIECENENIDDSYISYDNIRFDGYIYFDRINYEISKINHSYHVIYINLSLIRGFFVMDAIKNNYRCKFRFIENYDNRMIEEDIVVEARMSFNDNPIITSLTPFLNDFIGINVDNNITKKKILIKNELTNQSENDDDNSIQPLTKSPSRVLSDIPCEDNIYFMEEINGECYDVRILSSDGENGEKDANCSTKETNNMCSSFFTIMEVACYILHIIEALLFYFYYLLFFFLVSS
jgi:hypothetical protein